MKKFTNLMIAVLLGTALFMSQPVQAQTSCALAVAPSVSYTCTGNGHDGVLTLTFSNGTAPYSVSFNGNTFTHITTSSYVISGLSSGTYPWNVTDTNGCSVGNNVVVAKNTLPLARIAASKSICEAANSSVALGFPGVSGNTYSWVSSPSGFTSSAANPSVSVPSTTSFTLTETNPNGCSKSNSMTITVNPFPFVSVAAASNIVCPQGTPVPLTGTPAGGVFSGNAIVNDTFYPSSASLGNNSITYTATNAYGCSNSATTYILVTSANVSVKASASSVCLDGSNVALTGTPGGGIYIGDGVTDSSFNPKIAGIGFHLMTYYYSLGSCTYTEHVGITVNPLPTVKFPNAKICQNAGLLSLNASPIGGVYSGSGVSAGKFDPTAVTTGAHTILYSYTDSNGCTNTATDTITVLMYPGVSFSLGTSSTCVNGNSIRLSGGSPSGGTYSGPGVSSGIFVPANAGAGTQTLTYTIAGTNMCVNSATQNITVNALPTINFPNQTVCIGLGSITLNATPSGGSYSGTGLLGLLGNTLNLVTLGLGNHNITYTYTDANGCTNSVTSVLAIAAQPTVSISSVAPLCVNGNPVTLSGSPSGGTFSGTGVIGGIFYPSVSGTGSFTVIYSYTDGNGCTNATSTTVTVNAQPTVSIASHAAVCSGGNSFTLSGSPSGGTFSGSGVSGSTFNPATAGAGSSTVTYTYTNANGCSNSANTSITVNAGPTASFSVSNSGQCVSSNSFSFTDASTSTAGTISSWSWSFGDNSTSTSQNPTHSYTAAGIYTVSLTVTSSLGCTGTVTKTVTVGSVPTASYKVNNSSQCITGNNFSFTDASTVTTGSIASWAWNFGDNNSSTSQNPSHSYSAAGTYTVSLTVTTSYGCSAKFSATVTVNAMPIVSVSASSSVCVGSSAITLTGTPAGGTFSGTGVSGSTFNPATAGIGNTTVTYTYKNANGCANMATTTIAVTATPTAAFGIDDNEQCLTGNSFNFTDSSTIGTGSVSAWSWSFGDNTSSTAQNPSHTYAKAGTYTVTLSASAGAGCAGTVSQTVIVDPMPVASFKTNSSSQCAATNSFTFTDASTTGTGTITGWAWDFGDNSGTSSQQNPTYVYNGTGTFTVTLTITNSNGCTAATTTKVTVNAMPSASFAASTTAQCLGSGAVSFTDGSSAGTASLSAWSWNFGDNTTSTSQNPSHTFKNAGVYNVVMIVSNNSGCTDTANTQVTVYALPTGNAGSSQAICNGSSANLGTTAVSGDMYAWTSNPSGFTSSIANPSVSPSATTTYTLTETNSNGCSASNSVTITVNSLPAANAGADQSICSGSSATIGTKAVSGSKYAWTSDPSGFSSTSATATVSPSVNTDYTVTETNASGCVASNVVTITVNPLPAALAGNSQTIKSGSSTTIGGAAVSGSTYSWTSSPSGFTSTSSSPSVSPAANTTYTVTETNASGCKATSSVTITVTTSGAAPTVTTSGTTTFCSGGSVTLTCSKSTSYQWSNQSGTISGATSQSYTATAAGTYYVTAVKSGASGTSAGVTVTVIALPAAYTGSNVSICKGNSVVLGGAAVSGSIYKWSAAGNNAKTSKITVSPSTTTTYSLTETNANGCSQTNSVTVTVVAPPSVSLASFSNECSSASSFALSGGSPAGGSYTVDGSAATSFNPFTAGTGSHTITYTYTNATGCSATATQYINVVSPTVTPSVSTCGSTSFCSGGAVKLTANASSCNSWGWGWCSGNNSSSTTYSWSNQNGPILGATSQSLVVTTSGTYYVTATANGCSATSSGTTVTVSTAPIANAGSSVTYNYGYDACPTLTGSANVSGATYKWSTGATTQSITVCPTQTTTYWLTVSHNGCSSSPSYVTVYIRDVHCYNQKDKNRDNECMMCQYNNSKKQWGRITVSKSDVNTYEKNGCKFDDCGSGDNMPGLGTDEIIVYPNPFTSQTSVQLTFANDKTVDVQLWSVSGKMISTLYSGEVSGGTAYQYSIDGSPLKAGIYFVRVISGDQVSYAKIELLK